MKLIMNTYPGFQDLPKGVRRMLLVSESYFFDEMQSQPKRPVTPSAARVSPTALLPSPSIALCQNLSPAEGA